MSATGQIAARLAALEQQVATLRSQAGGGEQLSPNYLTVNAQGQVGANFTGKVTALGLIIPAQAGADAGKDTGTDAIQWIRQADGAVVADMFGGQSAAGQATDLQISVLAADTTGGQDAILALTGNLGTSSRVDVKAGTQARTLLNGLSQSQFLQLLSTQQLQTAIGTQALGWTAGNAQTNLVTVTHGVGRVPRVYAGDQGGTNNHFCAINVTNVTTTTFDVHAISVDGTPTVGGTTNVAWLAIG